jgi:hypothetical protein
MAKLTQVMNDNQILHQYRMMASEQQHAINRRTRGEIDIVGYKAINEHVATELKRLTCLYRGWEWPQGESNE